MRSKIEACLIIFISVFMIFGCTAVPSGDKEKGGEEISEAASEESGMVVVEDVISEEDGTQASEETEEASEPEEIEASESEKEILHFVDVFGEEYEVEIDPDIPKHPYDLSLFEHKGQKLTYDDDKWTSRLGIDVSHHQGDIDWKMVADQGFEFAILRIGYRGYGKEGKVCPDNKYQEYIKGAKEAGLDVGVYFFAQAVNEDEAIEEAEFVLKILDGTKLDLPVVYDPESILDDEARTDDVSGEQFTKNTVAFLQTIKEAGYEPMVYSNMLWEAYELDLKELQGIPVWYADYEILPQTPYDFTMWQYSNEGKVRGILGVCDLDIQLIKK